MRPRCSSNIKAVVLVELVQKLAMWGLRVKLRVVAMLVVRTEREIGPELL